MLLFASHQLKFSRARSLLLMAIVLFAAAETARSQISPRPSPTPPSDPTATERNKEDDRYGSPENEMRAKLIIKEEKKRYDENLGRAREVFQLANQLTQSYEAHKSFNAEDGKKLERLEKLTKRIRNEAGGSDSDDHWELKDIPEATVEILKRVTDWADDLRHLVEKTPRKVISAAVIDQANKLLGLVQRIRGTSR